MIELIQIQDIEERNYSDISSNYYTFISSSGYTNLSMVIDFIEGCLYKLFYMGFSFPKEIEYGFSPSGKIVLKGINLYTFFDSDNLKIKVLFCPTLRDLIFKKFTHG